MPGFDLQDISSIFPKASETASIQFGSQLLASQTVSSPGPSLLDESGQEERIEEMIAVTPAPAVTPGFPVIEISTLISTLMDIYGKYGPKTLKERKPQITLKQ